MKNNSFIAYLNKVKLSFKEKLKKCGQILGNMDVLNDSIIE